MISSDDINDLAALMEAELAVLIHVLTDRNQSLEVSQKWLQQTKELLPLSQHSLKSDPS